MFYKNYMEHKWSIQSPSTFTSAARRQAFVDRSHRAILSTMHSSLLHNATHTVCSLCAQQSLWPPKPLSVLDRKWQIVLPPVLGLTSPEPLHLLEFKDAANPSLFSPKCSVMVC